MFAFKTIFFQQTQEKHSFWPNCEKTWFSDVRGDDVDDGDDDDDDDGDDDDHIFLEFVFNLDFSPNRACDEGFLRCCLKGP